MYMFLVTVWMYAIVTMYPNEYLISVHFFVFNASNTYIHKRVCVCECVCMYMHAKQKESSFPFNKKYFLIYSEIRYLFI